MQENQNPFQGRLNLLFTIIFVLLAILILRLSFVQIVQGEQYRTQSSTYKTVTIVTPAARGLIYDRDHNLMVDNQPSYEVQFNALNDNSQNTKAIATKLAPYLKQTDETQEQTIKRLVTIMNGTSSSPGTLASNLNNQTDADKKIISFVSEHGDELPGVSIQVIPQRHYIDGTIASHVIGHLVRIPSDQAQAYKNNGYQPNAMIGGYGLEQQYESDLRGTDGKQVVQVNNNYVPVATYQTTPPVRGHDLVLNLDAPLQKVVNQALAERVNALSKTGTTNAAAVAIDPNTGEVLAMGSYPEFDPNEWVNGISDANYQKYLSVADGLQLNHALQTAYPPGSTVKPVTVMTGLHEHAITPTDVIYDPGYLMYGPNPHDRLNNWWTSGDGPINAVKALARSNNTYMGSVFLRLGGWFNYTNFNDWAYNQVPKTLDLIHNYHQQMGLGVSTGIDLPEEIAGKWYQDPNAPAYDLAATGIGQTMTYTATQLAQYTGMLANGGTRYELHVVHQIDQSTTDPATGQSTENVVKTVEPKALGKMPFTADELNVVLQGMRDVVQQPYGTAYPSFVGAPYVNDLRAKTGTSENANDIDENSVFIGFMPADKPTIAVAIIIPNVPNDAHSYQLVGPVARTIMDEWYKETQSKAQTGQTAK
ncbi:MAG: hypothetical protein JWN30_1017 [Bacilli bacterium]|nr:hypothetical protein [Bacilli bacterium]